MDRRFVRIKSYDLTSFVLCIQFQVQKQLDGRTALTHEQWTPQDQNGRHQTLNLHEAFELITITTWNISQLARVEVREKKTQGEYYAKDPLCA